MVNCGKYWLRGRNCVRGMGSVKGKDWVFFFFF